MNNQSLGLHLDITGGSSSEVVATKGIGVGGALASCAAAGQTAPNTGGGVFSALQVTPTLSDNGTLAFSASVGLTDSVFTCNGGASQSFALQGDPRPSPPNTVYQQLEEASIGGEESSTDFEVVFLDENRTTGDINGIYVG